MHMVYSVANRNSAEAQRRNGQRFGNRVLPVWQTFGQVDDTSMNMAPFRYGIIVTSDTRCSCTTYRREPGHRRTVQNDQFEGVVLDRLEEEPTTSMQQVAAEMGAGNETVWQVWHDRDFYPYNPWKIHTLRQQNHCP
ncbi:hypothetical protein PR048_000156 [Dryococelus australis]|uniref:Uncharacterized protein n=1 Tax=Dryococelus australis TaxID=614101 RepID=A0ABQ9IF09_9NEOP|nr:hypothetical protein PR048_000156 [Dryococelus australis]